MRAMRKGQTEVAGLLVIVILLIVIGMIYLRFRLAAQEDYSDIRASVEAGNLLKAVMRYNVGDVVIVDLLQECFEDNDRCRMFERELQQALEASLQPQLTYQYTLVANNRELARIGACSKGMVGSFITIKEGIILESKLVLCSK